ncbi:hypothetical protein ACFFX0_17930 [Citricoccus parietis]|uniref:Uncharacterized protein n=1 Tax=Citricoccus parietis TaxID=592307 RepID=A0ABV5G214_9MICC
MLDLAVQGGLRRSEERLVPQVPVSLPPGPGLHGEHGLKVRGGGVANVVAGAGGTVSSRGHWSFSAASSRSSLPSSSPVWPGRMSALRTREMRDP